MRILQVSDSYFPTISGVVSVVYNYSLELKKKGHKIFLLVPGDDKKSKLANSKEGKTFKSKGIKNPFRRYSYFPFFNKDIWDFLKKAKPEIIHIHTPGLLGLVARFYAIKTRIPLVVSVHGMPSFITASLRLSKFIDWFFIPLGWQFWRWFLRPASLVITPSNYLKKRIKKIGVKNNMIFLPFWNDFIKKNSRKKIIYPKIFNKKHKKIFLYLGRIDKDKNLDFLINSWGCSNLAKEKGTLVLMGFGNDKKYLEKIIKFNKIKSVFFLWGYIPKEEIQIIFSRSDFFVIPSNVETQSIITYGAMFSGLPIIGSSAGALPEAVAKTPFPELIFKKNNKEDLIRKIELVLKNPLKYKKGYSLSAKVEKQYTKQTIISCLEKNYRRITRKLF